MFSRSCSYGPNYTEGQGQIKGICTFCNTTGAHHVPLPYPLQTNKEQRNPVKEQADAAKCGVDDDAASEVDSFFQDFDRIDFDLEEIFRGASDAAWSDGGRGHGSAPKKVC